MPKEYNIQPTRKQKAAAKKMSENVRNSKGQIFKSVGYKKSVQKSPTRITNSKGFKIAQRDILEELKEEERKILEEMEKKRKKANYGTLAMSRKYVREQAWQAEDRLKDGGSPPKKIEIELTIK
jgi:hypothetical protein